MTIASTAPLATIGTAPAVMCAPTSSIAQVARQMAENQVGAIVVADEGRAVGIVTDRDLVVRGIAAGHEPTESVSAVMSHDVACIPDAASTLAAARQMAMRQCRRLPVVDDDGHVLAVVSADDIIRCDAEQHELLARVMSRGHRS